MTAHAITAGRATPVATPDPGETTGAAEATLLPDSDSLSSGGLDDALGLLYAAMAQQGQSSMQASTATVKVDAKAEQQALA
ncbi:MAG TPA: hypothetical protein VHS09_15740, partial [Polyangiaceae bacterium]|nr:hypothetical protein [Polyangiaceae bacterium]